ncbi:GxxExxY protein [Methylotuvimicrobium sp. KM2]|uniref:GxxExxY protein n=1 Tax=Methylotuvimicrobium sp. KM2 TaxID=3133976 RepID=UPI003100CDDD
MKAFIYHFFITMKGMKIMKGREFSDVSTKVIGCAIEVHRTLGPGLLESTYLNCLAHELNINQIEFKTEYPLPVQYKGIHLDCGYKLDLLIENQIILELKSVDQLKSIHEAQLLTYMKLMNIKQGFLINFNVKLLKQGLRSFVL